MKNVKYLFDLQSIIFHTKTIYYFETLKIMKQNITIRL